MHRDQIALQLWTVRERMAADPSDALAAVAVAGYRAVELAAVSHIATDELRELLVRTGLRPIASHESIESLRADPEAVAARLTAVGCPTVIVPWLPAEDRLTHSDVRRFAAELGRLATAFADHGIGLGYHNHDFEFAPIDGTTIWDILLAELSADIELELDVYWASVAGRDPVALIAAAPDRIRSLHMKDRSPGPEPHDLPAGEGTLDFPGIVDAGRAADVGWYVAEQDEPGVVLDDIASAFAYLESLAT